MIIGLIWLIRREARREQDGRGGRGGDDAVVAGDGGADPAGRGVVVGSGNPVPIQVIKVQPATPARRAPDYGARTAGKNGDRKDAVSQRRGR